MSVGINFMLEKKQMYMKTLYNCLAPMIYEGLTSIYDIVKDKPDELKNFQILLRDIPTWTHEIINEETDRILKESECTYLLDLLKAIVKTMIIIMASEDDNLSENNIKLKPLIEKVNIDINKFIHNCYIECAKKIDENPVLFYHKLDHIIIKNNQREIKTIILDSINDCIQKLLPVDIILKEYLGENKSEHSLTKNTVPENSTLLLLNALSPNIDNQHNSINKSINDNKSLTNIGRSHNELNKSIQDIGRQINEPIKSIQNIQPNNESIKQPIEYKQNNKIEETEAPYYNDDNGNYEDEFSNNIKGGNNDIQSKKQMYFKRFI